MKAMFLFGGITHYFDPVLKKIAAKGVEITVVVPSRESDVLGKGVKRADNTGTGYRIIEGTEKKSILGKNYFQNLPEIIEAEKPDLLITGWPYFLGFFLQRKLRKTMRKNNVQFVLREIPFQVPPYAKAVEYFRKNPMIDEEMNVLSSGFSFFLRQHILMYIRRFCYRRADGALAYSSDGMEIMPTYSIDKKRIFVTYNSGDSEALIRQKEIIKQQPPILPANENRIIHIGRLVKWKRVDLLLKAFQSVLQKLPQAELVILGDGPELENLKLQAKQLGVDKNVIFTGALYDPAVVGAFMSASSLYVLAGMGGLSINDAMAYGLPVVCSVCDSTEKDLVTHGVNGYFFRNGDMQDLSEKIISILENPELRKKMGQKSLSIIENKINIETVSNRYKEAFVEIIKTAERKAK